MLLLDATVAWLHALGAERHVVIVLDDLQWIDQSSLSLLEMVVGAARGRHPFFTRELAVAAAPGRADDDVPAAVRDAVERRVRGLSPQTQEVLEVAAVAGKVLLPDVVAAVSGRSATDVTQAATEAADAEMLLTDGERARKASLHVAIGPALEERVATGTGSPHCQTSALRRSRTGMRRDSPRSTTSTTRWRLSWIAAPGLGDALGPSRVIPPSARVKQ